MNLKGYYSDRLLVVLNYGDLIELKMKWDRIPNKNNLVFFDPTDKRIKVRTKTGTKTVAKVRKGREADAKKVAEKLDALFRACDYPSIKLTRKMTDLL